MTRHHPKQKKQTKKRIMLPSIVLTVCGIHVQPFSTLFGLKIFFIPRAS